MASGFLLSMLSPVWRAKLLGGIGTDEGKKLNLEDEDESLFSRMVALGCGESVAFGRLEELLGLVRIADRYQVEAI